MNRIKTFIKESKGHSLTEFSMVMPILLLLAISGMDVANMLYTYNRLVSATREGARLASEATDVGLAETVRTSAISRAQRVMTDSGIPWWESTVDATWKSVISGGQTYNFLTVQAQFDVDFFFEPALVALGFQDLSNQITASSTGFACMNPCT